MRCPKCGYNSFDYLSSCKKCGKDLVEFKQNYGIKSVLFPGQMSPDGHVEDVEFDTVAADAAVTAATGATVAATTATAANVTGDESATVGTDGDDFGFDFMGDSAEDDDLSFDELFEEAPEDEDIEETIEAPKEAAVVEPEAKLDDDFSFDPPDEEAGLEDDFGFDPAGEVNAAADDFDFNDADDESESTGESKDSGPEEGPERPFDLPESPQVVGAPEDSLSTFAEPSSAAAVEESGDMFVAGVDFSQPDDDPESYVFEPAKLSSSPPDPVEKSEQLAVETETDVAVMTPLAATAVSAVSAIPSVVESPIENIVDRTVVSPPSLGSCVGAFVCDLVLLVIVGISFIVAAEAAMSTGETRLLPSLETLIDLSIPYFLVLFFLAFGYFTLFHFLVGQTPGKMLTGLRVETTEGEPLVFSQAFLRSVGGLLQLLPVGLGYLVVLASDERRGWNDRLAGTRVVVLQNSP